jgi:glycosyltransferase involved in cell wall biosynthesis
MRILINAVLYGRGGIETHLLHLSKVLINAGHEVVLACRYANQSTPLLQQHKQLGVTRLTTPFDKDHKHYKWSTVFAILIWPFYLIRKTPDIVLTFENTRIVLFLHLFLHACSKVVFVRAGMPAYITETIPQDILSILDGVITESALQSQASLSVFPNLPAQSIPLLGNISENPKPRSLFSKQKDDVFHIAFMGRYDIKKGIYRLLEIWPLLRSRSILLNYYGHGSEKDNLVNEIKKRNLENRICVYDGWTTTTELQEMMENVDLLVLPSEAEGLPIILMEAMAYGVPFVATDVGAVRTYAENNPDVRVVPLDNDAIAFAIDDVVSAIRAGTIQGQRLQSYYNEHYAFSKLAKRWVDAIEEAHSWTLQTCDYQSTRTLLK